MHASTLISESFLRHNNPVEAGEYRMPSYHMFRTSPHPSVLHLHRSDMSTDLTLPPAAVVMGITNCDMGLTKHL